MEVSSKQILSKIEELVGKAKQANSEDKLKGYILAIQALCEVMTIDEPSTPSLSVKPVSTVQTLSDATISKTVSIDNANGSSIFDF